MTNCIRCLIVDDEQIARHILRTYLEQNPNLKLVGECRDAMSAKEVIQRKTVDLLLLDVQMPRLSGIELLVQLENPPLTILTTAFPDFALHGYSLDVVDYLLKPIRVERFEEAISKVRRRIAISNHQSRAPLAPFILVRANQQYHKVLLQDILYVQSLKEYVLIKLKDGRQLLSLMALKDLEATLPPAQFLRIHRSHIISLSQITAASTKVINLGDTQLRVGGNYRQLVVDRILNNFPNL